MTDVIFVYGKVIGKPRPKFSMVGGHPRAYTPKNGSDYEKQIKIEYLGQGGQMHEGPVAVWIDVYRSLPKSAPKSLREENDTHKPDVDNIAKIVLDALNGIAFKDDKDVVLLHVRKHPRRRTGQEQLRIMVEEMDEVGKRGQLDYFVSD